MANPRRFLGRKASSCRKCGGAHHYVNRMGGVVCEKCDPPACGAETLQRLVCVSGSWDDPDNPIDVSGASVSPTGTLAASASPAPAQSQSQSQKNKNAALQLPEGTVITPESTRAIREMAADRRLSPAEWLDAMSAVFTERESEWGWSATPGIVVLRELQAAARRDFPGSFSVKEKSEAGTKTKTGNSERMIFQ